MSFLISIAILLSCAKRDASHHFCDGYAEGLVLTGLPPQSCPVQRMAETYEHGLLIGLEQNRTDNPFLADDGTKMLGDDHPLYHKIRNYGKTTLGLNLDALDGLEVMELRSIYNGYFYLLSSEMMIAGFNEYEQKAIEDTYKSRVPHAGLLLNLRRQYILSMVESDAGLKLDDLCRIGHFLCDNTIQRIFFKGSACSQDCSGHIAGYEWAKSRSTLDESDCDNGKGKSFIEGCYLYFHGY